MAHIPGIPDRTRTEIERILSRVCRHHGCSFELDLHDSARYVIQFLNPGACECYVLIDSPFSSGVVPSIRSVCIPPSFKIAHTHLSRHFGECRVGDVEGSVSNLERAWQWANEQVDPFPDVSVLTTAFFVSRLRDPDEGVRMSAADSLRDLRDRDSVGPLIEALSDAVTVVRSSVASALGYIGDERAIPALQALLRQPDDGPSFTARRAIAQIRETNAT